MSYGGQQEGRPGAGPARSMPFEEQMQGGKFRPKEDHYWSTGRPGNVRKRPNNM